MKQNQESPQNEMIIEVKTGVAEERKLADRRALMIPVSEPPI